MRLNAVALLALLAISAQASAQDPLPSWNDGAAKKAIVAFVQATTTQGGPKFVAPDARIATFDQDGTLWVEHPIYTQVMYSLDKVPAVVAKKPELANVEPFKTVMSGNHAAIAKLTLPELEKILGATLTGMTVEQFNGEVKQWMATAKHPRWKKPYTELTYQPMLELMQYLRANQFKTYIVTGGGQDFVRVYAQQAYGVPPDDVIGSTGKLRFEVRDGHPVLVKLAAIDLVDDGPGKPAGIHQFIGQKPILAFGNSDGDFEMLEYTTRDAGGPRLGLLLHHTDAEREYAYDRDSLVGRLRRGLDEAAQRGWIVVDMKSDWRTVFIGSGSR